MALRSLERSVKFLGITGLLPLTEDKTSKDLRFKISKLRIGISIFIATLSVSELTLRILYYEGYEDSETLAQYMLYTYWTTMNGITSMTAHLLAIKNRNRICKFCNTLAERLHESSDLSGKLPEVSLVKFVVFGAIAAVMIIAFDFDQWEWVNIPEYVVIDILMIVVLHLGVLHLVIAAAVQGLNDTFKGNLEYVFYPRDWWAYESLDIIRTRFVVELIQRYCAVYHDLFELTQEFSKVFATVSLCLISHMFMMIIIATFNGLRDLQTTMSGEDLILIGWTIYGFSAIVLLIFPCVTLMNQGTYLAGTVNKFLAKSSNDRVTEQLMRFAMLLTHEKIIFSPHNLFSFTYGLIPTIAGSSISYMIILTQFENNNKNCTV